MMKIMFLYHVKEREYQIIEMIKAQILCYSQDVDIKTGEFYGNIKSTIEFRPDVIVSIPPRDCYCANYLTMLKLLTRAVVISMTTEGNHTFEEAVVQDIVGYNTYSPRLVDYYIMWGPKTGKILGDKLFDTKKVTDRRRIKATGYAFYELSKAKELFAEHYEYKKLVNWADKYQKTSLVLTGFSPADWTIQDFFYLGFFGEQRSISKVSKEQIDKVQKLKERFSLFREKYINDIINAAERMPEMGFFVKLHPTEVSEKVHYYDKLTSYPNINVVSFTFPVGALLSIVDVMIHYNSTTNMEAYIYGVPTILRFDKSENDLEELLQESTYSYCLDESEEFIKCLQHKCEFRRLPKTEKNLFDKFNWKLNKPYRPVEKIAAYILKAGKPQCLSCFDKEVIKAVKSKEGREVEKWLFFRALQGNFDRNVIWMLMALFKVQIIKIVNKVEGLIYD